MKPFTILFLAIFLLSAHGADDETEDELVKAAQTKPPSYFMPFFESDRYSDGTLKKVITRLKARGKAATATGDTRAFREFFEELSDSDRLSKTVKAASRKAYEDLWPPQKVVQAPWTLKRFESEDPYSPEFAEQFRTTSPGIRGELRRLLLTKYLLQGAPHSRAIALLELFREGEFPEAAGVLDQARPIILKELEAGGMLHPVWLATLAAATPEDHQPSEREIRAVAKGIREGFGTKSFFNGGAYYDYVRQLAPGAIGDLYLTNEKLSEDAALLLAFSSKGIGTLLSSSRNENHRALGLRSLQLARGIGEFSRKGFPQNRWYPLSDETQAQARKMILSKKPHEPEIGLELLTYTEKPAPLTVSALLAAIADENIPEKARQNTLEVLTEHHLMPPKQRGYQDTSCPARLKILAGLLFKTLRR